MKILLLQNTMVYRSVDRRLRQDRGQGGGWGTILTKSLAIIMPSSTGRLQSIVNFRETFFFLATTGFAPLPLLPAFPLSFFGLRCAFFLEEAALAVDADPVAAAAAFAGVVFALAVCHSICRQKTDHSKLSTYHCHCGGKECDEVGIRLVRAS